MNAGRRRARIADSNFATARMSPWDDRDGTRERFDERGPSSASASAAARSAPSASAVVTAAAATASLLTAAARPTNAKVTWRRGSAHAHATRAARCLRAARATGAAYRSGAPGPPDVTATRAAGATTDVSTTTAAASGYDHAVSQRVSASAYIRGSTTRSGSVSAEPSGTSSVEAPRATRAAVPVPACPTDEDGQRLARRDGDRGCD